MSIWGYSGFLKPIFLAVGMAPFAEKNRGAALSPLKIPRDSTMKTMLHWVALFPVTRGTPVRHDIQTRIRLSAMGYNFLIFPKEHTWPEKIR